MSRGRRDVLRSLTTLLVLGSMTIMLLVFSLLTNTRPVSLAHPAVGNTAANTTMKSCAVNRRRVGTSDPLLLAKTIGPSVRLIQVTGQAPAPILRRERGKVGWERAGCNGIPPRRTGRLPADGRSFRRRDCGARPAVGQGRKDLRADPGSGWRQPRRASRRIHRPARSERRRQVDPFSASLRAFRTGFRPHRGDGPRHDAGRRAGIGPARHRVSAADAGPRIV